VQHLRCRQRCGRATAAAADDDDAAAADDGCRRAAVAPAWPGRAAAGRAAASAAIRTPARATPRVSQPPPRRAMPQMLLWSRHVKYNAQPPPRFDPGQLDSFRGPVLGMFAEFDAFGEGRGAARAAEKARAPAARVLPPLPVPGPHPAPALAGWSTWPQLRVRCCDSPASLPISNHCPQASRPANPRPCAAAARRRLRDGRAADAPRADAGADGRHHNAGPRVPEGQGLWAGAVEQRRVRSGVRAGARARACRRGVRARRGRSGVACRRGVCLDAPGVPFHRMHTCACLQVDADCL
jgi:hypothetical protein